jgi:hypothetical protein
LGEVLGVGVDGKFDFLEGVELSIKVVTSFVDGCVATSTDLGFLREVRFEALGMLVREGGKLRCS